MPDTIIECSNEDIMKQAASLLAKVAWVVRTPLKNATNPFLKNKYADLGEVIDCVKVPLQEYGFFLSQSCELILDGKALRVHSTISHVNGFAIRSSVDVLLKEFSPQGTMSAFTYGRRYAILSMFNLAAEDDDANVASGKADAQSAVLGATISKDQAVQNLQNLMKPTVTSTLKK